MTDTLPHILFVDDEHKVLDGLRRQLRERARQWHMFFESRPTAALARMATTPANVVVSDMDMPTLNGLDMIREMRTVAPHTTFIMLTGVADLQVAVDAINQAKVFRFYTKPCATEYLVEGIEAALRSHAPATRVKALGADAQSAAGLSVLDQIAVGVVVVDADARVILTNQSAADMLSAQDGLLLSTQGICRAGKVAETEVLHQLVRQVASSVSGRACGSMENSIAVSRRSAERPLSIAALPLTDIVPGEKTVALFVSDPDRFPLPSRGTIADLFGLTMAEAGIVSSLAQGARLEDAATAQGVTVSTARTYLKQAFAKTNTCRQSEIVKLVLTTTPPISPSSG